MVDRRFVDVVMALDDVCEVVAGGWGIIGVSVDGIIIVVKMGKGEDKNFGVTDDDSENNPVVTECERDGSPVVTEGERDERLVVTEGERDGSPVVTEGERDGSPVVTEGERDGSPVVTEGARDGSPVVTEGERDGSPVVTEGERYVSPAVTEGQRDGSPVVTEGERDGISSGSKYDDIDVDVSDTTDDDKSFTNLCPTTMEGEIDPAKSLVVLVTAPAVATPCLFTLF
ncbi:hypothetical protein Btru_043796 [Bulinus truncatus]|nr:hypothetical protein Btru_043796 [Bulinus truncatus]